MMGCHVIYTHTHTHGHPDSSSHEIYNLSLTLLPLTRAHHSKTLPINHRPLRRPNTTPRPATPTPTPTPTLQISGRVGGWVGGHQSLPRLQLNPLPLLPPLLPPFLSLTLRFIPIRAPIIPALAHGRSSTQTQRVIFDVIVTRTAAWPAAMDVFSDVFFASACSSVCLEPLRQVWADMLFVEACDDHREDGEGGCDYADGSFGDGPGVDADVVPCCHEYVSVLRSCTSGQE